MAAVEGIALSRQVEVKIIRSISSIPHPADSKAALDALTAKSEGSSPSLAKRRSLPPQCISTQPAGRESRFSSSSLFTTVSGTYLPQPAILALLLVIILSICVFFHISVARFYYVSGFPLSRE